MRNQITSSVVRNVKPKYYRNRPFINKVVHKNIIKNFVNKNVQPIKKNVSVCFSPNPLMCRNIISVTSTWFMLYIYIITYF